MACHTRTATQRSMAIGVYDDEYTSAPRFTIPQAHATLVHNYHLTSYKIVFSDNLNILSLATHQTKKETLVGARVSQMVLQGIEERKYSVLQPKLGKTTS